MITSFIVYDNTSGLILWTGSCPVEMVELQPVSPNESALAYEGDIPNGIDDQMVNLETLELEPRPALPEVGPDTLHLLPEGTVVRVWNEMGDMLTITDFTEPLTLTDPGTYRFIADAPFPYITSHFEVVHA